MLKLHQHFMSPASRYARLLLAEYGCEAECVEERPWERRDEFLRLNPAGSVPVLLDGAGAAICGAVAIGEYMEETTGSSMGARRLMPERPRDRAEVRRLVEWYLVKLDEEVSRHLIGERVHKRLMGGAEASRAPDASLIRAARANLKSHMRYTGWLSQTRDWLAGGRASCADMAAAASLSALDYLGEIDWASEPTAREWYARIKSRPSFRPLLDERLAGFSPPPHYGDLDF